MLSSPSRIVHVAASDGIELAMRIYGPADERRPVLFAASPYRFDNDDIPPTNTYLWRETGPIDWYVGQGYAYVHMDVRGTGRSGGEYGFLDRRERRDLYDAIEWIAVQPWCTGKVGGIGHSYYATTQWAMASERPPHLACVAPYDGHVDLYRGWAYHGGLSCSFLTEWWHGNVRTTNAHPLTPGAPPRDIALDLPRLLSLHPLLDDFWEERAFANKLDDCTIPVFSIGAWCKRELHLGGNIEGFCRVVGPKKLLVTNAPNMPQTQDDFESAEFHAHWLLPFYDRHLKGRDTVYDGWPAVQLQVANGPDTMEAPTWPPQVASHPFFLAAGTREPKRSLNDGILADMSPSNVDAATSYSYPDPYWAFGNVSFTGTGFDPLARNLTFVSEPFERDCLIAGTPLLRLWLSGTRDDARVVAKLSEEIAPVEDKGSPRSAIVAKGWLRASHRAIISRDHGLLHDHARSVPIEAGQPSELEIAFTPTAYRIAAGSRLRLDLSCTDSPITDAVFFHATNPNDVGTDTIHHSMTMPSVLELPLVA